MCGRPRLRRYCNTGDWVDSCTALVEHADGRLEVLRWLDIAAQYAGAERVREPKSALMDFLETDD